MSEQPLTDSIAATLSTEMLSPQQRTYMVAEILATIALRVVKQQQEPYEQEQTF